MYTDKTILLYWQNIWSTVRNTEWNSSFGIVKCEHFQGLLTRLTCTHRFSPCLGFVSDFIVYSCIMPCHLIQDGHFMKYRLNKVKLWDVYYDDNNTNNERKCFLSMWRYSQIIEETYILEGSQTAVVFHIPPRTILVSAGRHQNITSWDMKIQYLFLKGSFIFAHSCT